MKTENKKQTNKENNTMKTLTQHTTIKYLSLEDISDIYFEELDSYKSQLQDFSNKKFVKKLSNAHMNDIANEYSIFNKDITLSKSQKSKMKYDMSHLDSRDYTTLRFVMRQEIDKMFFEEDRFNLYKLYTINLTTLSLEVIKNYQKMKERNLTFNFEEIKDRKLRDESEKYVKNNDVAYKDDLIEYFEVLNYDYRVVIKNRYNKNSICSKSKLLSQILTDDVNIELKKITEHIKKTHDIESFALKKLKEEVTYELRVDDELKKERNKITNKQNEK